jgi:hypothetical protein
LHEFAKFGNGCFSDALVWPYGLQYFGGKVILPYISAGIDHAKTPLADLFAHCVTVASCETRDDFSD